MVTGELKIAFLRPLFTNYNTTETNFASLPFEYRIDLTREVKQPIPLQSKELILQLLRDLCLGSLRTIALQYFAVDESW